MRNSMDTFVATAVLLFTCLIPYIVHAANTRAADTQAADTRAPAIKIRYNNDIQADGSWVLGVKVEDNVAVEASDTSGNSVSRGSAKKHLTVDVAIPGNAPAATATSSSTQAKASKKPEFGDDCRKHYLYTTWKNLKTRSTRFAPCYTTPTIAW